MRQLWGNYGDGTSLAFAPSTASIFMPISTGSHLAPALVKIFREIGEMAAPSSCEVSVDQSRRRMSYWQKLQPDVYDLREDQTAARWKYFSRYAGIVSAHPL